MLRFIIEEFAGVTSVQAGSQYVAGLRADGTAVMAGTCQAYIRGWICHLPRFMLKC